MLKTVQITLALVTKVRMIRSTTIRQAVTTLARMIPAKELQTIHLIKTGIPRIRVSLKTRRMGPVLIG